MASLSTTHIDAPSLDFKVALFSDVNCLLYVCPFHCEKELSASETLSVVLLRVLVIGLAVLCFYS